MNVFNSVSQTLYGLLPWVEVIVQGHRYTVPLPPYLWPFFFFFFWVLLRRCNQQGHFITKLPMFFLHRDKGQDGTGFICIYTFYGIKRISVWGSAFFAQLNVPTGGWWSAWSCATRACQPRAAVFFDGVLHDDGSYQILKGPEVLWRACMTRRVLFLPPPRPPFFSLCL